MKHHPLRKLFMLLTRWEDEKYLLTFFLLLLLAVFVIAPLELRDELSLYTQPLLTVMVISGVFATSHNRWVRNFSILVAIIDFLVTLINYYLRNERLELLDVSITIMVLLFLTGAVLVRVFRDGQVNFYRILGSVSAYILIGMVWGLMYYFCYLVQPGSFHYETVAAGSKAVRIYDLNYFSFTTLFTVGYGDITPVLPFVRSLAMLEGLIGQLYPVILIARLVSLEIEAGKYSR